MALALTEAGVLPTLRRLREPLTAGHANLDDRLATGRPVRLRVIA
jgi:hypothetical protein